MVRNVGRKDLVIGISFRRGLRQTVEGLQTAKRDGAFTLAITDTFVSPLARAADECIIASVETPSFGASYVAPPMALIDAIVAAVGNLKRRRIMSLIKQADEEQRRGFRLYQAEF